MNVILFILFFISIFIQNSYGQITEEWRRVFGSPDGYTDYSSDITTDNSGNVIISSTVFFKSTFQDIAVLKYSPGGIMLWDKYYNSEDSSNDRAHAVVTDYSGNVIVTGESMIRVTGNDIVTIKYDPEGNEIWRRTYNGNSTITGKNNDEGYKVLSDISGNVYVGGSSQKTNSGYDFILLKYDHSGNLMFEKRFSGTGNRDDKMIDMKTDRQGNIYLAGEGYYNSIDYLTVKYDSSGIFLWSARYDGLMNIGDYAKSLCIDNNGNAAITGFSYINIFSIEDIATVKYSPDGIELWKSVYNGTGDLTDKAFSIESDTEGNLYVAGFSGNASSFPEYTLLKYQPGGNLDWIRLYDHTSIGSGEASHVKVDLENHIIVSGTISRAYSQYSFDDIVTLKYDINGNRIWTKIFNGPDNNFDRIKSMHLDFNSNIYFTGVSRLNYQDDILVYKYSQTTGTEYSPEISADKFILEQNYPNPFNSQTIINFSLPQSGYVSLILYDLTGKEIKKVFDKYFSKGYYSCKFDAENGNNIPGGVYFYVLNAGGKLQTRKLVLLK